MPEDPTPGELMRGLMEVKKSLDALAGRVMTVDLWKAEREGLEYRLRETEKDISDLQAKRTSDNEKRDTEKRQAAEKRTNDRRLVFAALIAPALLLGLKVWAALQGAPIAP